MKKVKAVSLVSNNEIKTYNKNGVLQINFHKQHFEKHTD